MSSALNSSNLINSNYNQNYNNNSNSVFDYLIKKLDSRIKNLHKTRIAINNIVDMNELRENKIYMSRHFQDIEEEINQAIHSLKALITQNADVSEHAEICLKKARGFELKLISETKANNELKLFNENLNKEIFDLKSTLEEKNSLIVFLNEKITFYENKLQQKDKEILEIKGENERRDEQIKRLFKEIEILNVELDAKNFNAAEEIGNRKEAEEKELDIDNLKGILSERENKKKLINEKIKEHIYNSKSSKRTKQEIDKNRSYEVNYTDNSKYQFPLQIKSERNIKNFFDPEELRKSHDSKGSKLSKHELISELIMKITSTPENIDYLNKKFGNDFMNKIFSPETEEDYLRALEKALEEKNLSQRTGDFAASFGKKDDLDSNRFKNQSNPYKKNSRIQTYNSSDDNNSSPEKDSNYVYTKGSSNLKRHISNIKNEITNNSSFNKYKNNYRNENNNKNKVISNIKNSIYLNPFESKDRENKQLNKSVSNLVPGKNYAKNILCKTIGEKFKTPIGKVFDKNLRFYGTTGQNSDMNRSYAKSSDKKYFNNYCNKNSRTFEDYSKTKKIQAVNKNSAKSSKYKNPDNSKQQYLFKESNSHEISFSNNHNNNSNNNYIYNKKNEHENVPIDNPSTNRSNQNNNENNTLNNNLNYLRKYENLNNSKEKSNIAINEDYNYPYSSGNEKAENEDQDNLNQQIDEFINENFNERNEPIKSSDEKFEYVGTHHSQKEKRSEKDKKNYNFESDRVSLDKNNEAHEDNMDDLDMESLKNTIYNNLNERDMQ